MTSDLKTLFRFEEIIIEMQSVVTSMITRGAAKETVDNALERIDKLIEIKNTYDKLYFSAYYAGQKIRQLQSENIDLCKQIADLTLEKEKYIKCLQWNSEADEVNQMESPLDLARMNMKVV